MSPFFITRSAATIVFGWVLRAIANSIAIKVPLASLRWDIAIVYHNVSFQHKHDAIESDCAAARPRALRVDSRLALFLTGFWRVPPHQSLCSHT